MANLMANLEGVYAIAREVFRNRNAAGAPARHRAKMKVAIRGTREARGPLRLALLYARMARDAIRAGDSQISSTTVLLARSYITKAQLAGVMSTEAARKRVWVEAATGRTQLTDRQKTQVHELLAAGMPQKTVAHELGVSAKTIGRLVRARQK